MFLFFQKSNVRVIPYHYLAFFSLGAMRIVFAILKSNNFPRIYLGVAGFASHFLGNFWPFYYVNSDLFISQNVFMGYSFKH